MTNRNFFPIVLVSLALCATVIAGIFILAEAQRANASAPIGLVATVATSSTLAVGPQNNMFAFGTTTANEGRYQCDSRIISTVGYPILISFASLSSTTLSTSVGHLQTASTTVAYDGGLYGCGYMTIRGLYASSTITISETR